MLKKIKLISLLILSILFFSTNKSYANLNNVSCENPITNSKTNIVYGNNFAKEEMSPNIWLFFHDIKIDKNNLNIVSLDDGKAIREWKINLSSGDATLIPMFDPTSKWLCKL